MFFNMMLYILFVAMRTSMHSGDEALLAAAVCDAIALKKESDDDDQKNNQ
jgi:hypothetical protein